MLRIRLTSSLISLTSLLAACSGGGGGSAKLEVAASAEDTITQGLQAGTDEESIADGWDVAFDKYIAVLGDVHLISATDDSVEADAAELYAIDLARAPSSGFGLWSFDGLAEGRYEFGYSLAIGSESTRHDSVSEEDFARMGDWSYLIVGALTQEGGVSCPPEALADVGGRAPDSTSDAGVPCFANPRVEFEIGTELETAYSHCQIDGVPGVAVTNDRTSSAALTIHGDHVFFNGFPEGDEGTVVRRAQWLADCDLNLDGSVTQAELEQVKPADLPSLGDVPLGGSPITPVDSMWTYVRAQLKSQGHFEGEGECALDGAAHSH
ncbi:MAG TPA: hypothetical protein VLC09_16530 [Polyangiaceae bacterium]|nr:hypothetical protein [Polyangiaceae bacterium]